ncbi:MAG: hypothetical protein RIG62_18055 [Cyclobacteriaceae bacterium]
MVLMFSVIYQNRAIPVVWAVVRAKKGHLPEQMHRLLLERLSEVIPAGCQVSIVGDGEYDGCDWQADIVSYGWDYVLRTGCTKQAGQAPQDMLALKWLAPGFGQTTFTEAGRRLTVRGFLKITKLHLGQAYSPHSLRASFVTVAKRNGASNSEIMRQTFHKTESTIRRYTRFEDAREHNAAMKLGLH